MSVEDIVRFLLEELSTPPSFIVCSGHGVHGYWVLAEPWVFEDDDDKLEAALRYMEDVCGPSFLGAVEMTGPLDVWSRVEQAVDTTFTVDFPAIASWGFRMSQADSLVRRKPDMPVLAVMGLESESAMPGFRETQRFLMNWFPQAERCGIMNATHGLQSMNPVAVGEGAHAFLKKHPMI